MRAMRAVREKKMEQMFKAVWTHQTDLLKEAFEVSGIINFEMGTITVTERRTQCVFEEMERGLDRG